MAAPKLMLPLNMVITLYCQHNLGILYREKYDQIFDFLDSRHWDGRKSKPSKKGQGITPTEYRISS